MNTLKEIERCPCPFCESESADRFGFGILSCQKCGASWTLPKNVTIRELRKHLKARFPDAHREDGGVNSPSPRRSQRRTTP